MGKTVILTLPLTSMRAMADAAAALEAQGARRFPLDAAKVIGPTAVATEIELTLPSGWRVQLPPEVSSVSKWGSYTASYRQQDTNLRISRRLEGTRGVYPPSDLTDLTRWLREIARDDVSYLVIETSPTP